MGIHAFRNDSDERASMLISFSPETARERYFEELADLARTGRQLTADEWRDLYVLAATSTRATTKTTATRSG